MSIRPVVPSVNFIYTVHNRSYLKALYKWRRSRPPLHNCIYRNSTAARAEQVHKATSRRKNFILRDRKLEQNQTQGWWPSASNIKKHKFLIIFYFLSHVLLHCQRSDLIKQWCNTVNVKFKIIWRPLEQKGMNGWKKVEPLVQDCTWSISYHWIYVLMSCASLVSSELLLACTGTENDAFSCVLSVFCGHRNHFHWEGLA